MQGKGFITLWFIAAVVMALSSLAWHGVLLNDIERLQLPLTAFAALFGVFYLGLGFVLTALCVGVELDMPKPLKGMLMGGVFGFFVYLLAFALGLGFQEITGEHLVFDFAWQMLEQGLGGLALGIAATTIATSEPKKSTRNFTLESIIKKKTTAA